MALGDMPTPRRTKTEAKLDIGLRPGLVRPRPRGDEPPPVLPPLGDGGYTLSFAQTEAGERLQGLYAAQLERERGRQRLRLEGTLQTLAKELLPPRDVGAAIQSIQRGELVKSKLAFQTALQALQDRQEIQLRREELRQREEVEKVSLKQARSKLVVDMIGRDLGRAILFALGTGEGQGQ